MKSYIKHPIKKAQTIAVLMLLSSTSHATTGYDLTTIGVVGLYNKIGTVTDTGYVTSSAAAFNGTSYGSSTDVKAWVYYGSTTYIVGLVNSDFSGNILYRSNYITNINNSGTTLGTTQVDTSTGARKNTTWLYDGVNTTKIGLTGENYIGTTGNQGSYASRLNNMGQVAGSSSFYNGSKNSQGITAWIYDGNITKEIGLTEGIYIRSLGSRSSASYAINDAGHAGQAERFDVITPSYLSLTGSSAWIYDGNETKEIGLTGSSFTYSNTGYKKNTATAIMKQA